MNIVHALLARFVGAPTPDALPAVSPQTVTRATTPTAAAPAPVPAPAAEPSTPVREEESPAVTALRVEVQMLRLMKTDRGRLDLLAQLRQSEAARRALEARLSELQTANEDLTRGAREVALENERLTNDLVAARLAARR